MSGTHRAGSRKSGAGQSAAQIVLRIIVLAGKVGTAQTENGFDLCGRCVLGEQLSGQPQIDDAPIGLWKALANVPTLDPALIDGDRSLSVMAGDRARGKA